MSYPHLYTSAGLGNIAAEVDDERAAQDRKFGPQDHPDGTTRTRIRLAAASRARCRNRAEDGRLTWRHVLDEEVQEAFAEEDPAALRVELVQIAAVAVAWIQALDRRRALGAITQADWAANADPS